MMSQRCPATDHAPVTMTPQGWADMCKSTMTKELNTDKHRSSEKSFCSQCRGKIVPPNLTIKTKEQMLAKEEKKVPQKAKVTKCEGCGDENLTTRKYYERQLCGKCHTMFSNVRNYLPVILKAMAAVYPDQYGQGVTAEQVNGTTVVQDGRITYAIAKIAEVVDYPGENADNLADHVEQIVTALRRRVQEMSADMDRIKGEYTLAANRISELETQSAPSVGRLVDSRLLDLLLDCPEVLHSREKLIAIRESVQ